MLLPILEIERNITTNLMEIKNYKKKTFKNGVRINSIPQIKEKILGSITYQKTRNKSPK